MNKSAASALVLIRAAVIAKSHSELEKVLEAYREAPLQQHDAKRVFLEIQNRREALEAEADMWADRAMPESPFYG